MYSKQPPNIEPIKFEPKDEDGFSDLENDVAKITPEKYIGKNKRSDDKTTFT